MGRRPYLRKTRPATGLGTHLTAGTLPTRDDQIALGDGLAKKLGAHLGDAIVVHLPAPTDPFADDPQPAHAPARVQTFHLAGVEHADAVAKAFEDDLGGPPYHAMDWYELNKPMYSALLGDKRP